MRCRKRREAYTRKWQPTALYLTEKYKREAPFHPCPVCIHVATRQKFLDKLVWREFGEEFNKFYLTTETHHALPHGSKFAQKSWKLVEFCPLHHPPPFRASNLSFFSLSPFSSSQASRETELYTGMSASASASSTALPLAVSSWGFYFSFETPRGCLWRSASSPTTAGRAEPGRGSEGRRSSRQRSEVSYFQMTFFETHWRVSV